MELDEAAQDVFVNVYQNIGNVRRPSRFSSYVMKAAQRRMIDSKRVMRKRELSRELDHLPARTDREDTTDSRMALQAAIAKLPDSMQITLGLKCGRQRTSAEIAETLGQSVNTVTKTLSRAYERLRADVQLRRFWEEGE